MLPAQLQGVAAYLRALVFVPQINTIKGIRTDDIGAGPIRWAVAFHVPCHGGLSPLCAVHGRRQGQMLAIESAKERAGRREEEERERERAGECENCA